MDCKFFILKGVVTSVLNAMYWEATESGTIAYTGTNPDISGSSLISSEITERQRILQLPCDLLFTEATLLEADDDKTLLARTTLAIGGFVELNAKTTKLALSFKDLRDLTSLRSKPCCYIGLRVVPYYKNLKLKYAKETNQMFFRATLEGKITLHGLDFEYIASSSLDTKFLCNAYRHNSLISSNVFNKTSCSYDTSTNKLELKFEPEDRYTKLLAHYEDTFDLIKCGAAISKIEYKKRMFYQIYRLGSSSITNYFANTYFETDVLETIDDADVLVNTYHFGYCKTFTEINIKGLTANQELNNKVFPVIADATTWYDTMGQYSIVLEKAYSAGVYQKDEVAADLITENGSAKSIYRFNSRGIEIAYTYAPGSGFVQFYGDAYHILVKRISDGVVLYKNYSLVVDTNSGTDFTIDSSPNLPMLDSDGNTDDYFYLNTFVLDNPIYARLVADIDSYVDSSGKVIQLYGIPVDDVAVTRGNYNKCIGLTNLDLWQSNTTVTSPTKYGINDFEEYFTSNFLPAQVTIEYPRPVARSNWGNTSMWLTKGLGFDKLEEKTRKSVTLNEAYELSAVIKALLAKIDSRLSFEALPEYSNFLYGAEQGIFGPCNMPTNYRIYMTPKSNVLKSNYDQAARKAEITFKEVMELLRDCFKCYWFVDTQNRFRVEHISFFMNGFALSAPSPQLDLLTKKDRFNKKNILCGQINYSYDTDLPARYEFNWADNSTTLFGQGQYLNIRDEYVKGKKQEININKFSADLDYMLVAPGEFSSDGFALLIADKLSGNVPIVTINSLKDDEFRYAYKASIQNYYASWLYTLRYYMFDIPGENIEYNNIDIGAYTAASLARSKQQELRLPSGFDLDLYKAIRTNLGLGIIDSCAIDIDSELASVILIYEPN